MSRAPLLAVLALAACAGARGPSGGRDEEPRRASTEPPPAEPFVEVAAHEGASEPAPDTELREEPESVTEVSPTEAVAEAPPPPEPAPPETALDAALVRRGRRAYERVCVDCHEESHRIVGRRFSRGALVRRVRDGGTRMPPISTTTLSARDLEAVVAYLSSTVR